MVQLSRGGGEETWWSEARPWLKGQPQAVLVGGCGD